jgi:hypothetical protein
MTTFKYPITILNGTVQLTSEYDRTIPEVIAHILQTTYEERVMTPDFGIGGVEFTVVSDLPRLLRSLEQSLTLGLSQYPGVTFRLVGYLGEDGEIPITCFYQVDEQDGEIQVIL